MRENPLRAFRERRLGWSRSQLGRRIGRSDKLVALYEAEIPDDLLRELARIAQEEGHPDYEQVFLRMISPEEKQTAPSLPDPYTPQTPEEASLVRAVLEILRDPDPGSQVQAGLPQMIRQIQAHRKEFYKRK
jgi:transcriptional regulator with XRE-family HTH domain